MGSIKRGVAALLAASCLLVSACSGGGGSVDIAPAAEFEAVNSSSGLTPDSNGFAFANFGSSASQEVFDEGDLVEMFGESVCVDGIVDPCAPTEEAAAWARMVNDSRAVGHCEGLVVQAALRYSAKLDPQTVTLKNEGDVTHGIMRAFATQFLPEVQKSTKAWSSRSLKEIVAELVSAFKTGTTSYTLGVYSPNGGHAVLPYAVEFPTPERADILLYDSNWPGLTRKVVIDLATDMWFFSFDNPDPNVDPSTDATAWSGSSGSMDITPMDSRSNATCPMCGDDSVVRDTILTIRSVDGDWSIKTKNGVVTAQTASDVDGVRVTSLRGAASNVTDSIVIIESADFDLTLNSTANAYVNTIHGTSEIRAVGKKKRAPIVFKENSISFTGTDADITVAKENLVVNTLIADATINIEPDRIDVLTTSGGAERTVTVDSAQPRVVITGGGDEPIVENRDKALNSVLPVKVNELSVPDVRGNLTPRVERDLANAAYVQQYSIGAATTTTTVVVPVTTVAATTTVAPATTPPVGAPTSTPSATTVGGLKTGVLSASSSFVPGGSVSVSYAGFEANEWVQLIVASTPQVIDVAKASASGKVNLSGNIPSTLTGGSHTLAVYAPQSKRGFKQSITVQTQSSSNAAPATTTTAAVSSITTGTNTPATTQSTAVSPATTGMPASTTTINTSPVITTFECVDTFGGSQLKLRVVASDAQSGVTYLFEEPNSTKYYIDAPTSSSGSSAGFQIDLANNRYIFDGYWGGGGATFRIITVKLTVSDGTLTTTQTRDFYKNDSRCYEVGSISSP